MEDIQAFYDVMLPRMDVVTQYLNALPLDALPPEAERLMYMGLSLMEVANAVEIFQNPAVINGFAVSRFVPIED